MTAHVGDRFRRVVDGEGTSEISKATHLSREWLTGWNLDCRSPTFASEHPARQLSNFPQRGRPWVAVPHTLTMDFGNAIHNGSFRRTEDALGPPFDGPACVVNEHRLDDAQNSGPIQGPFRPGVPWWCPGRGIGRQVRHGS